MIRINSNDTMEIVRMNSSIPPFFFPPPLSLFRDPYICSTLIETSHIPDTTQSFTPSHSFIGHNLWPQGVYGIIGI